MRPLLPILVLLLAVPPATADDPPGGPFTISVSAMAGDGEFTPAQRHAMEAFGNAVRDAGLDAPGGFPITLFLDAAEIDGGERLVLSVSVLERLPERVVALGAEAEAFYDPARLDPASLPAEGSHVRQALSVDWLRDYHSIVRHHLLVLAPAELEARAAALVAAL